ncbi:NUDIX domain-containing protein [Nocardia sp. CNY236]|uniref:NUDIX domain-containing protein n=1 Tax=Nocardia sp. CNY236 TaxID=1169152 RepID=UPI0018CBD96F
MEPDETPEQCVAREITEEIQWPVTTGPILDSWIYQIDAAEKHVFIVTYGYYPDTDAEPIHSQCRGPDRRPEHARELQTLDHDLDRAVEGHRERSRVIPKQCSVATVGRTTE